MSWQVRHKSVAESMISRAHCQWWWAASSLKTTIKSSCDRWNHTIEISEWCDFLWLAKLNVAHLAKWDPERGLTGLPDGLRAALNLNATPSSSMANFHSVHLTLQQAQQVIGRHFTDQRETTVVNLTMVKPGYRYAEFLHYRYDIDISPPATPRSQEHIY